MNHKICNIIKLFLKRIIDFILYSNLWIAAGAFMLCLQTKYLLTKQLQITNFTIFTFFATFLLYAVHRMVGLKKSKNSPIQHRYMRIQHFKSVWLVSALISIAVCTIFFFRLDILLKKSLLIPVLLAAGYAIPLLPKGKRLRDLNYLKIFLIVSCWSFVTVVLPAFEHHIIINIPMIIMILERSCYIFALAMIFDIRDLSLDEISQVRTIPGVLGIQRVKIFSYITLILMIAFAWFNFRIDAYTLGNFLSIMISAIIGMVLIYFTSEKRSDYFFLGLADGMLFLQMLLILLFSNMV